MNNAVVCRTGKGIDLSIMLTKPLCLPVIARDPSDVKPPSLSSASLNFVKTRSTSLKITCPVVMSFIGHKSSSSSITSKFSVKPRTKIAN